MRTLFLSLVVFVGVAEARADLPVESPRDRVLFPEELKPARIQEEQLSKDQLMKQLERIILDLEKAQQELQRRVPGFDPNNQ